MISLLSAVRVALCGTVLFVLAGCATHKTRAGRETTLLGGLAEVKTGSYEPVASTSADVDATKLVGRGNPSGDKISLLWGLITIHDY